MGTSTTRRLIPVLLIILILAPLVGALSTSQQAPTRQAFLLPVPEDLVEGLTLLVAGVTPYNVTLDYNFNDQPDPEEQTIRIPGNGEIALTVFRVPDNTTGNLLIKIIVDGGPATVLAYTSTEKGVAAFTAPKPGTLLLPPPSSRILIANPGPDIATINVGGEQILLPSLRMIEICTGTVPMVVESDKPVVAVAYGSTASDIWATEVLPDTEASRIIGVSSLQLGGDTYAVVRYTSGAWAVYKAMSLKTPYVLPGDAAVYYVNIDGGIGVSPGYNSGPYNSEGVLLSVGGLILGGEWIIAQSSVPQYSYTLYDKNIDGKYEIILFMDSISRNWIVAGPDNPVSVYTSNGAPTIKESKGDKLALYTFTFPFSGELDYETLYTIFGQQSYQVEEAETSQGENLTVTLRVVPALGYGGVVSAAAALFNTSLDPIQGTAIPLDPAGDGTLAGSISVKKTITDEGAYLIAAIAYQEGAGIITQLILTSENNIEQVDETPWAECDTFNYTITDATRIQSLEPVPLHTRSPPSISDLDIRGLGDLILEAVPTRINETTTPINTTTSPRELSTPPIREPQTEGSPSPYYITTLIIIILILIIIYKSGLFRKIF